MDAKSWLLLAYKVPPEPAKKRIALWRKVKSLGAVYVQAGVCLLPKTADHVRRLKIIENEIAEMGGEAVLLETNGLDRLQHDKLLARFNQERNEAYQEFLERCSAFEAEIARESAADKLTFAELEENEEDLKKLASWFEKIRKLDFHGASLATESRERLAQCEALLEAFAQQVFDAWDDRPSPRARKS
jgi:hypothetical protein